MNNFNCPKCSKNFNKKQHLQNHLNKKNTCILNPLLIQTNPNSSKTNPNSSKFNPNNNLVNDVPKKHCCEYCGNTFFNGANLNKHIRNNCKVKKEDDENKKNIFELLLEKERIEKERIEKEKNYLNNKLELQQNEMNELKKQLIELTKTIKKLSNKTTTVINNNHNNYGNINNIVVPNEKLSKFGKEDLSLISQKEFLQIKSHQGVAIFTECGKIIFNNKSVNKTVYISDLSRKKAMIWDGKNWILSDLDGVIRVMKEKIRDFYNLKLGDIEDEKILKDFETRVQKYFEMLYNEYDEDKGEDKKFMERVKGLQNKFESDLTRWLSNIKKDVIDNYNSIIKNICDEQISLASTNLIESELESELVSKPEQIPELIYEVNFTKKSKK